MEGKIGGDSLLSPRGGKYAEALPALVRDNIGEKPLTVWTSTLRRTIQTGSKLPYPKLTWKSLDELDAGVCDGMTYEVGGAIVVVVVVAFSFIVIVIVTFYLKFDV